MTDDLSIFTPINWVVISPVRSSAWAAASCGRYSPPLTLAERRESCGVLSSGSCPVWPVLQLLLAGEDSGFAGFKLTSSDDPGVITREILLAAAAGSEKGGTGGPPQVVRGIRQEVGG